MNEEVELVNENWSDGMDNADADADGLLSTKSPTSTYVNAPIQFNVLSSVMIVPVMMPLWQMKLSLQALRREMSMVAA